MVAVSTRRTVTTFPTVSTVPSLFILSLISWSWACALVGFRHDVNGSSEVVTHLLDALLVEIVIKPLPIEVYLKKAFSHEASAYHLHLEVSNR
jgi:hypothetical protein